QSLDERGTRARLPYGKLTQALREILEEKRAGKAYAPSRVNMPLASGGSLLLMPAADERIGITKLVTVHPANSKLPVVQADVLIFNAATGERLFLVDGATVTARRTAAVSLLAVQ